MVCRREQRASYSPTVTLSPILTGSTFPAKLDLATCSRELSRILVPEPTEMLFTSPKTIIVCAPNHKKIGKTKILIL